MDRRCRIHPASQAGPPCTGVAFIMWRLELKMEYISQLYRCCSHRLIFQTYSKVIQWKWLHTVYFKWMFPKIMVPRYPQIIHSNRVFHYKPSILGTSIFGNIHLLETTLPPCRCPAMVEDPSCWPPFPNETKRCMFSLRGTGIRWLKIYPL